MTAGDQSPDSGSQDTIRTCGGSLDGARFGYIVDDVAADRKIVSQVAIDAGLRVEHFEGGGAFLESLSNLEPGIIFLDVMMPCVDGLSVLDAVMADARDFAIIMMSAQADVATAVKAMRHGAHDFLLKPIDVDEAATTVRRVCSLLDAQSDAANARVERDAVASTISPKEMRVLRKLLAGKRNKTVAFELGVSERTVEVHRSRLIERVRADNFAGLITFAVKAGIEPDA